MFSKNSIFIDRPRVKYIRNLGKFKDFKGQHSGGVFFMYVGEDDPGNDLMVRISKYLKNCLG